MRHIFIGDIHGCLLELDLLIKEIKPDPADALVFLGDLIDRGPDNIGVVRRVKELLDQYPSSVCVAGNHENYKIELLRKEKLNDWAVELSSADWNFLKSLPLLKQFSISGSKAVAVHGGFYPKFFVHYKEGLSRIRTKDWHRGGGKYMRRARRFLYTRYIDTDGNVVAITEKKPGSIFWAEKYNGNYGYVFYGHEPYLEPAKPKLYPHACGLDTGCVFGGSLTAAIVTDNPRNPEFVSIPALKQYAKRRQDI